MKMMLLRRPAALAVAACFATGLAPLVGSAADSLAAEDASANYLALSAGGALQTGDRAGFQKRYGLNKSGFGGIDGFNFTRDLDKSTTLTASGHAFLIGNNDYLLDLRVTREDVGFINIGLKGFRSWFDGNGGYFPPNSQSFNLYDADLHVDRSNLWLEAGYVPAEGPHFNFRYDYLTRKGLKDSTIWGDTSLTAGNGTRAIAPAFLRLDEQRHILNASMFKDGEGTNWNITTRYEASKLDNAREIRRRPGESTVDRDVTQKDGVDSDLFMVHSSFEKNLSERLLLTSGAAYYTIDTTLEGSRIYGTSYDPVFDPAYARRQYHDEGFYDLEGGTQMRQTMATLSLMYTPNEVWAIVPSLRAEKTTWDADADFIETAVGAAPALAMGYEDLNSESNKNWRELAATLETRYTGIKNWTFNARGELISSYGTLSEDLIELETGVDALYRTTNFRRDAQKIALTGNWYARPGLSFSAQYYWKGRQNSFNNTRTSVNPAPTSGDRYPAYITNQDFETNDLNLRATWRPLSTVRLVTRYDYQESTIRTQEIGLPSAQSGKLTSHVISETATWNPLARWYLQGSANVVFDQTVTPASTLTGAAEGIVLNSDNNYINAAVSTGYALDDKTDVTVDYNFYRANNFVDNSNRSLPYGASATEHYVSVTWQRRVSPRMQYAIKYAYADNDDKTSGGLRNYRAHLLYTKIQYYF
ncbi:MAG: hypothetical protein PHE83_17645 [Opitutaceae bacterium]|nr:hypothetical protein [Opitutaceae bacterium]